MKFSTLSNGFIASTLLAVQVLADCSFVAGNYYCSQVDAVTYDNVGFAGSYQDVTGMNADGTCNFAATPFSGSLAPLDQDLSVHFRGPLNLKQFAVYYPSSGSLNKREQGQDDEECASTQVRHAHVQHKREADAVHVTTTLHLTTTVHVQATPVGAPAGAPQIQQKQEQGVLVSNAPAPSIQVGPGAGSAGSAGAAAVAAAGAAAAGVVSGAGVASGAAAVVTSAAAAAAAAVSSVVNPASNVDGWVRSSYFDAPSSNANNVAFLNNLGGTAGSGVWSSAFGNSLSYCAADGVSSSPSAQVLGDVTIPSNSEFIIFSGEKCTGSECGYYREGIPAYKGFSGASKLFVFEFQMPTASGASSSFNYDMPAIWLLNAKIPRVSQYSACSCWATGCGEFDIFEVLNAGNDKLTNHLHTWQGANSVYGGGGTADYFARPLTSTMKAGVLFNGDKKTISIFKISDDSTFGDEVSQSTLSSWLSGQSTTVNISS